VVVWYIFPIFGMFRPRKIWQPWLLVQVTGYAGRKSEVTKSENSIYFLQQLVFFPLILRAAKKAEHLFVAINSLILLLGSVDFLLRELKVELVSGVSQRVFRNTLFHVLEPMLETILNDAAAVEALPSQN
jgi:hypothetical protein